MLHESWPDWQQQVTALIRCDLHDVLADVREEDIDWEAWRPLYDEGRSAQAAVDHAFARVA